MVPEELFDVTPARVLIDILRRLAAGGWNSKAVGHRLRMIEHTQKVTVSTF
jgi:hypothetical protein